MCAHVTEALCQCPGGVAEDVVRENYCITHGVERLGGISGGHTEQLRLEGTSGGRLVQPDWATKVT